MVTNQGAWKGYVVEIDSLNGNSYYGISIKIDFESINLFYSFNDEKCTSKLQIIKSKKGFIEANEKITYGMCVNQGKVILKYLSPGIIEYFWYSENDLNEYSIGTLHKFNR